MHEGIHPLDPLEETITGLGWDELDDESAECVSLLDVAPAERCGMDRTFAVAFLFFQSQCNIYCGSVCPGIKAAANTTHNHFSGLNPSTRREANASSESTQVSYGMDYGRYSKH